MSYLLSGERGAGLCLQKACSPREEGSSGLGGGACEPGGAGRRAAPALPHRPAACRGERSPSHLLVQRLQLLFKCQIRYTRVRTYLNCVFKLGLCVFGCWLALLPSLALFGGLPLDPDYAVPNSTSLRFA